MPVDITKATEIWTRYEYLRDNGHNKFVEKADQCDRFFQGMQWDSADLAKLKSQRRPALTINKILSTISNVLGEQINNRTDIMFQPRSGAPADVAEALTKVFKQIADNNQLDWLRSDMFCDGVISSRGFLDVRLDFTDSMQGEVRISLLNPKNVLVDSDAEDYDPDTWNDVIITKWMTHEDIAVLYNKSDADLLKDRNQSWFQYGFDSIERYRDRFGNESNDPASVYGSDESMANMLRNIRVIERQHRRVVKSKFFVETATGDMRDIPDNWDRNKIAAVSQQFGLGVTEKLTKKIRWTTIADNVVLHDEWSPYEHFTPVPYFPYFRRGKTLGLVENLIGPQELLNKVASQELHVVNTTANSGWKIKSGSLRNMSIEELEQRGAETGLVLELDDVNSADKIQPNQVPSGLDRISYKAEEHIKTISGVSDYQTGSAREDVSAKAVALNQQRGALNNAKSSDSLNRTDFLLGRNVLSLVQRFYTEPRLINITKNRLTGEQDQIEINQQTPEGTITNDLTLGEYDVVVLSTPHKATFEQGQFEQAQALKELGIPIPDEILIEHSQLYRKGDIIKAMQEKSQAPEQLEKAKAELDQVKGEAARLQADAMLKVAKSEKELAMLELKARELDQGDGGMTAEDEIALKERELEMDYEFELKKFELEVKKLELELELKKMEAEQKMALKQQESDMKMEMQAQQMDQQQEMHDATVSKVSSQNAMAVSQAAQGMAHGEETHKQSLDLNERKLKIEKEKARGRSSGSKR